MCVLDQRLAVLSCGILEVEHQLFRQEEGVNFAHRLIGARTENHVYQSVNHCVWVCIVSQCRAEGCAFPAGVCGLKAVLQHFLQQAERSGGAVVIHEIV